MVGLPLVLKLGGSLVSGPRFTSLLELVAAASRPVVLVPGGGLFADAVRTAQRVLSLNDELAHRLALLSMHQMGLVLASKSSRFCPAETPKEIDQTLANGQIPVWLPYAQQHSDETLAADWSVTSDALAARLAERLGGAEVALVKSCQIAQPTSLAKLTSNGIVDPTFSAIVSRSNLPWHVYGQGDDQHLQLRLTAPSKP